jgi:hypothetical protein
MAKKLEYFGINVKKGDDKKLPQGDDLINRTD